MPKLRTVGARRRGLSKSVGFALLILASAGLGYAILLMGAAVLLFGTWDQPFGLIDYLEVIGLGIVGFGMWRFRPWVIPAAASASTAALGFMLYWLAAAAHPGEWERVNGIKSFLIHASTPWWWQLILALLLIGGLVAATVDPEGRDGQALPP